MCKKDEVWKWKISSYHERNEETETLSFMRKSKERCFDKK